MEKAVTGKKVFQSGMTDMTKGNVRFALIGVGCSVIPMMVGISEILTRAAVTYLLVYRIVFLE